MIRQYTAADLDQTLDVWNEIVRAGNAFPQDRELDREEGGRFFESQSYCAVADLGGKICGLYVLHPNNVGHCAHQCNASFAVAQSERGKGIGEALVRDCLHQARKLGFELLIFNAVVKENASAVRLYRKLGFKLIGEVERGFCDREGNYHTTLMFYRRL